MGRGKADLMDAGGFLAALPGLFEDFPKSERPSGRRFDDIIAAVPNLSTENNLALLNLAASLLPSAESYVEVGSFMGASLIGAMRENEDKDFVAIDRFESTTQPFSSSGSLVSREAFDSESEALRGDGSDGHRRRRIRCPGVGAARALEGWCLLLGCRPHTRGSAPRTARHPTASRARRRADY